MKVQRIKAGVITFLAVAIMSSCGKSGSGSGSGTGGASSPSGPGGYGATGQCYPVNQPIPFSGQNIYVSDIALVGGGNQANAGQMWVGSGGGNGPYTGHNFSNDAISFQLFPVNGNNNGYGYYSGGPTQANIQGTVLLSAQTQYLITMDQNGMGGFGFNQGPARICGIALDMHRNGWTVMEHVYLFYSATGTQGYDVYM